MYVNDYMWLLLHMMSSVRVWLVLAFGPFALVTWAYYRYQKHSKYIVAIQGIHMDGVIIKRTHGWFHWYLIFYYVYAGKNCIKEQSVDRATYEMMSEGDAVTVSCLPNSPLKSRLVDVDIRYLSPLLALVFVGYFMVGLSSIIIAVILIPHVLPL